MPEVTVSVSEVKSGTHISGILHLATPCRLAVVPPEPASSHLGSLCSRDPTLDSQDRLSSPPETWT